MYDLAHIWNADLAVDGGGDLALVSGTNAVTQRVIRRLLTNPGAYVWNLSYGGGLAQFVGLPVIEPDITAVILDQLLLEPAVPTNPTPQVTTAVTDASAGFVVATITYSGPDSTAPVTFSVPTGS